jgi:serine/threonine protein phosphatase PrpC
MAAMTQSEVAAYAARGVSLRVASRTDVGLVRANNEDTLVLGDLAGGRPSLASGRLGAAGVLFGVCDGMGGAVAGEVASRMAAQVILQRLARTEVGAEAEAFQGALSAAVVQANEAIRKHVEENPSRKGMGTTCTVAAVRGGLMVIAQVGDSRAYLVRGGELRQLTKDQTWANEMLERGRVSPEQAAVMENGKAITQAVGTNEGLEVALVKMVLCQGDRILICSDGLNGMVPDADIARVIGGTEDPELASDELLHLALAGGGRDNVSFVLCAFTGKALGSASALEPEYRLPVKRGRKRAVAFVVLLLVLVAMLWRANESERSDSGGTVAHAAQSPQRRVSQVAVGSRGSKVMTTSVNSPAAEPKSPPAVPKVDSAASSRASLPVPESSVRPRSHAPVAQRPARQDGRKKPPPKIERPKEEEIRIIREDGPAAGSPF